VLRIMVKKDKLYKNIDRLLHILQVVF